MHGRARNGFGRLSSSARIEKASGKSEVTPIPPSPGSTIDIRQISHQSPVSHRSEVIPRRRRIVAGIHIEPRLCVMRVWPGDPYPLGATWTGVGVNFALFSAHATTVELCLFDSPDASKERTRIELIEQTDETWHAFLPDARPNQLYGYRVHGPYEPAAGHRFNPNKVVLDPYAKSVARTIRWADEMFGYTVGHPDADLSFDQRDNGAYA